MKDNNRMSGVKTSDYLEQVWRLVHVLTAKQKQDFKKSANFYSKEGAGNLQYLKLFDLVNESLLLAEKRLQQETEKGNTLPKDHLGSLFYSYFQEKFARQKAIAPSDLRKVCQYLFSKILESTRYQNESRSKLFELLTLLKDIQFLTDKDLLPESKALIVKAKEIARKFSFFEILMFVLRIERMQLTRAQTEDERKNLLEKLRKLEAEEQFAIKNAKMMVELRSINHESLANLWVPASELYDDIFCQKIEHFATHFPSEPIESGLDALIFWNNTRGNFFALAARKPSPQFEFLGDISVEGIFFHQRKIVEHLWAHPEEAQLMPSRVLSNLTNLVLRCTNLARHDEELYQKYESLSTQNIPETTFLKTIAYGRISLFLVDENRLQQGVKWLEEHRVWYLLRIHAHEIPRPNLQNLYFLGGLLYAAHNQWKVAQLWWQQNAGNEIEGLNNHESILTSIWWLYIAELELGEYEGYLYPKTLIINLQNRLLKFTQRLDAFDRKLLLILEKITPLPPNSRQMGIEIYAKFQVLEALFVEHNKKKSMATIIAWLKSKISEEPFARLLIRCLN